MNGTRHPLVETYLDDLARTLADLPPADRAEVMAGVREHIDTALEGTAQTDAEVHAVLAELGPVDLVAREALESAAPSPAPARRPFLDGGWVPMLVAALQVVALLLALTVYGGSGGYSVSGDSQVTYSSALPNAFFAGMVGFPAWLVAAILIGGSNLWSTRQKLRYILLLPVGLLLMGLLPDAGWALVGVNGIVGGAWIAIVLVTGVALWTVISLTRAARRNT